MNLDLHKIYLVVEVPYADGVAQTPRLSKVSYSLVQDSDASKKRHGSLHSPHAPRDLSAVDLSQTITQTLIETEKQIKAREGLK